MTDFEMHMTARGALIALLLLPVGLYLGWRWTAMLAKGPAAMRALVACGVGVVPPLLAGAIWVAGGPTQGRAHAIVTGCMLMTVLGTGVAMLVLTLWSPGGDR